MPDRFTILPLELRLQILAYVQDLATLYRLIHSSEAMKLAFQNCPGEIVYRCIAELPKPLRGLSYAVAINLHLLGAAQPVRKNDDNIAPPIIDLEQSEQALDNNEHMIRESSFESMEWFLLLACRMETLSAVFLDTLLKRINRIEIEHVPLETLKEISDGRREEKYPPGIRFTPKLWAHVRWNESLRFISSIWRLQLQHMLQNIQPSRCTLRKDYVDRDIPLNWEMDQLAAAQDFVAEEGVSIHDFSPKTLHQELQREFFYTKAPPSLPSLPCHSQMKSVDRPPRRQQGVGPNYATRWFWPRSRRVSRARTMYKVPWKPFRRMGLGMWDGRRIQDLGLLSTSFPIETQFSPGERGEISPGAEACQGPASSMSDGRVAFAGRSVKLDGERCSPDPSIGYRWGLLS